LILAIILWYVHLFILYKQYTKNFQHDMFLSKNSIIQNQIICIVAFSSDCRARISQYKFLLCGNATHTTNL